MKIVKLLFFLAAALIVACNNETEKKYSELEEKYKLLSEENEFIKSNLIILTDSISMLKISASDRLYQIKNLISENEFEKAQKQIIELKRIFPLSKEIQEADKLKEIIAKKEEDQKKEVERIKALGYKVFRDNTSTSIGGFSFVTSGFTFGRTYTFDHVNDVGEYHYRTADKDNTYLLISLSLSTKNKNASVPNFCLFEISNGILKKISYMQEEYASWATYGAFIGNYSETSHDFSKVNTVNYKLGFEISIEQSKQPLLVIVNKDGSRPNETLTIEDVNEKCLVVKVVNRNKL